MGGQMLRRQSDAFHQLKFDIFQTISDNEDLKFGEAVYYKIIRDFPIRGANVVMLRYSRNFVIFFQYLIQFKEM